MNNLVITIICGLGALVALAVKLGWKLPTFTAKAVNSVSLEPGQLVSGDLVTVIGADKARLAENKAAALKEAEELEARAKALREAAK